MSIKYINNFQSKAFYPNLDFRFETKPSGNPGPVSCQPFFCAQTVTPFFNGRKLPIDFGLNDTKKFISANYLL
jgi:hypothetical protein